MGNLGGAALPTCLQTRVLPLNNRISERSGERKHNPRTNAVNLLYH
jgi:hypothetical protein